MAEKAKSAVLGCFEKLNPFKSFLFLQGVTFDLHKKVTIGAYAAMQKLKILMTLANKDFCPRYSSVFTIYQYVSVVCID